MSQHFYVMKCVIFIMKHKDRFSVSMDKELVKRLDEEVDRGRYSSRSQAIEFCVKQKFRLEEVDERIGELMLELMELASKSPEFFERFKEIMKEQGG